MTLYVPVGVFFVWLVAMFVLTRRNTNRGDVDAVPLDHPLDAAAPGPAVSSARRWG
jgi:hypothetical protein